MTSTNDKAIITDKMLPQYDIEFALHQLLENGDESKLAQLAGGKAPSYYSQMLNPNDPRESIWFRAARDFQSLIQINAERGCKALTLFNSFVKRALPAANLCIREERRTMLKERMDADLAELEGLSIEEQIRELEEEVDAIQRVIEAKRFQVQKFPVNGNGRR